MTSFMRALLGWVRGKAWGEAWSMRRAGRDGRRGVDSGASRSGVIQMYEARRMRWLVVLWTPLNRLTMLAENLAVYRGTGSD